MESGPGDISMTGQESAGSAAVSRTRERDDVFWTELEIRRLGNLVAECIHARRYVGDTDSAQEERKLMRKYIEAMKRKSMRVLHRAELYAKSGHASWPGIDPTIMDPVSLAEEYVRVVENYETVLLEEESRAKRAINEASGVGDGTRESKAIRTLPAEEDDWEAADDVAYRDALKREQELTRNAEDARKDLLGTDDEGIRRRKGTAGPSSANSAAAYSKEDEELMARHQPIQDELTSNLVDLVGQLKESISANKEKLEKDSKVLDETEDAVDKNVSGVSKQRAELKKFSQSASVSWWAMLVIAIVILVVFALVFILLKIPML